MAVGMVCSFLTGTGATTAFAEQERVLSVGDGDTLSVREGGSRRTIRLACIDAPETAQSPYGSQARAALGIGLRRNNHVKQANKSSVSASQAHSLS